MSEEATKLVVRWVVEREGKPVLCYWVTFVDFEGDNMDAILRRV